MMQKWVFLAVWGTLSNSRQSKILPLPAHQRGVHLPLGQHVLATCERLGEFTRQDPREVGTSVATRTSQVGSNSLGDPTANLVSQALLPVLCHPSRSPFTLAVLRLADSLTRVRHHAFAIA